MAAQLQEVGGRAPGAGEDRILELGWKCDPAAGGLHPDTVVYTWYRNAQRREGAIVSYILIARY